MKMVKRQGYQWAAAICLIAGINTTQAAIDNGALLIQASGTGNSGELFLNVWDQLASTSYSIDLGVTVDSFLAAKDLSTSWSLDQRFVDWTSTTSNPLTFNVAGNNTYQGFESASYGVLVSRRTGASEPGGFTLNNLGTFGTRVRDRANSLNIYQVAQNPGATVTDYAANLSEVTESPSNDSYFSIPGRWGTTMGIPGWIGAAVVRNGETADQTLDFYSIHSPGGTVGTSTRSVFDKLDGYLTLDVNNAELIWVTTTTVPVPGTIWLFFSGLMAVLGTKRRFGFASAH